MLLRYNKGYVKCFYFCPVISSARVGRDSKVIRQCVLVCASVYQYVPVGHTLHLLLSSKGSEDEADGVWLQDHEQQSVLSLCTFAECLFLCAAPTRERLQFKKRSKISHPVATRMCFMFHYRKWTHSLKPEQNTVLLSVKANLSREQHKSSLKGAFSLNFEKLNVKTNR